MMILVVDDSRIVLESCRRVLAAEGYQVCLKKSAPEALEATTGQRFDLLLVDLKMPVQDGISLIQKIRQKKLGIPIIIMSGYSTSETIAQAAKMGAATFIPKPFTPDELAVTVKRVLDRDIRPVFLNGQPQD